MGNNAGAVKDSYDRYIIWSFALFTLFTLFTAPRAVGGVKAGDTSSRPRERTFVRQWPSALWRRY